MPQALGPCRPADDAKLTWMPPWLNSFPPPQINATLMRCTDCDCDIWVGPRNKAGAEAGLTKLVCYTCSKPYVEKADVNILVNTHKGKQDRPRR